MSEINEVVIVGSGPAGYTAAIYAARAQLKPIIYEGSVTAGGALMNTTEVENFPGFPTGVMGPELMESMRKQVERFDCKIITDDIVGMKLTGEIKEVTDGSGNTVKAKAVILAMGSAYKEIGLPNEKRLSGHGVSWCATCDGFFFRDQVIAVVGGGDSAMEEASFLTKFASKVVLIHRRDTFRASKIMIDRVKANPKIELLMNHEVIDVLGENKVVGLKDIASRSLRVSEWGLKIRSPDLSWPIFSSFQLVLWLVTTSFMALRTCPGIKVRPCWNTSRNGNSTRPERIFLV